MLRVENLDVFYGDAQALDDVSIEVNEGAITEITLQARNASPAWTHSRLGSALSISIKSTASVSGNHGCAVQAIAPFRLRLTRNARAISPTASDAWNKGYS